MGLREKEFFGFIINLNIWYESTKKGKGKI